jgi:lipopolysaccharide export system permease protein
MCAAACLSLTLLVFISVLFGNLNSFAEHSTNGSIIAQFLFFSLPQMVYWVLPFSVCVGIIAAQAQFSRHVETIAMQACSVSFVRLSLPYLTVGLLAMFVMSLLSFSLYPKSQQHADKIEDIYIKKHDITGSFSVNGGRFKVGNDIYYVEHMDILKGVMHNVTCYRIKSGKLFAILRSEAAVWNGKQWKTSRLETIGMSKAGIVFAQSASPLPLTHEPTSLVVAEPKPDVLTLRELIDYRQRLRQDGIKSVSLETQFHSRISFTLAPFIMTMLVMPFGLRFPRAGGIARGISIGIILGLFYWAMHSAMTGAGMAGYVNPALAAWSTNIVMMCAGIVLMGMRRKTYG